MPTTYSIPIRERIEWRLCDYLAAISGIHQVLRYDPRGLDVPVNLDIEVFSGEEEAENAEEGQNTPTTKTLTVGAQILVLLADDDTALAAWVHNRWLAALEKALTADPKITDGSGVELAIDSRIIGTTSPPEVAEVAHGLVYAGVLLEISYRHNRNDPAVGPGIAELLVAEASLPAWCRRP